jgi:hypothetical protein
MTTIALATTERLYKNNGQEAERVFRFTMTGELAKADNLPHDLGTDCLGYQVKSARATVCRGTDLLAYLATDKATAYAYVNADFTTAYLMTKAEYIAFVNAFGTITTESAKNGGYTKIRLKTEGKEMREWLARA